MQTEMNKWALLPSNQCLQHSRVQELKSIYRHKWAHGQTSSERHVLLQSSSNVRRRENQKTISAHKGKQLYMIDGPSAKVPLFTMIPVPNTYTFAPAPPSSLTPVRKPNAAEKNGPHETPNQARETSASHLAAAGLVKKSASWSAVPTFTTFNSPLLTLSCNNRKRIETCLWRPRPRLVAKPLAALESVRIFRVNLGQTPESSLNDRIPSNAAPFTQASNSDSAEESPMGSCTDEDVLRQCLPKRNTSPEDDRRLTKSPAKSASTHPFSSFGNSCSSKTKTARGNFNKYRTARLSSTRSACVGLCM